MRWLGIIPELEMTFEYFFYLKVLLRAFSGTRSTSEMCFAQKGLTTAFFLAETRTFKELF